MAEPRRQLVIENHTLLVCPYCWTREQIAKEYPELAGYLIRSHPCDVHSQILLTACLERNRFFPEATRDTE